MRASDGQRWRRSKGDPTSLPRCYRAITQRGSRMATRGSDGQRWRRSNGGPTSLLRCYRPSQRGSRMADGRTSGVRRVKALQRRSDLSPEMLQAIASRLEHGE